MKGNFWGFTVDDNYHKEEKTYKIGMEDEMPIALFLLLSSSMKEATARYCSLMTYTEQAITWSKEFDTKKLTELIKPIANDFEKKTPYLDKATSFYLKNSTNPEKRQESHKLFQEEINNQPRDIILPLHLYASQFARYMAQRTVAFRTLSEGVIMTCPPSYIGYWNREEFQDVDKTINKALDMIMEDVLRIFKIKNIQHNEYNMTLTIPGFESKKFIENYSW